MYYPLIAEKIHYADKGSRTAKTQAIVKKKKLPRMASFFPPSNIKMSGFERAVMILFFPLENTEQYIHDILYLDTI